MRRSGYTSKRAEAGRVIPCTPSYTVADQATNQPDLHRIAAEMIEDLHVSGAVPGIETGEQAPDASLPFVERLELGFDVRSDLDQSVIAAWHLQFELPQALRSVYRQMDVGLDEHNAFDSLHGRLTLGRFHSRNGLPTT